MCKYTISLMILRNYSLDTLWPSWFSLSVSLWLAINLKELWVWSSSETMFLIVIIVPGSLSAVPTLGPGLGVRPRSGQCGPGSAIHQPEPGPEARMMRVLVWVRQGWSQDKNREAEPWPGDPAWCIRGGGGGGPWGGAGAERERGDHRVTGATEPLSVWGGTRDRMVLTRGHEAAEMALWWLLGQCWQVQKRLF